MTDFSGRSLEEEAFGLLKGQIVSEQFGLLPHSAQIFLHKRYYSRDRQSTIEFDIAIEVTLPGAPKPSFLWLWECKDYSRPIPVDEVEEFNSKVLQVAGLNVKGGLITAGTFQRSALRYADARKIAVIRIMPYGQIQWMLYLRLHGVQPEISTDTFDALTRQDFRAMNRTNFGAAYGRHFATLEELFQYALLTEVSDLRQHSGLFPWVSRVSFE